MRRTKVMVAMVTTALFFSTGAHGKTKVPSKVKVRFDAKSCFPGHWYEYPISARTRRFDKRQLPHFLEAYRRFVAKYPPGVIDRNLEAVYLFGRLNFYGKNFGGTYKRGRIFIQFDRRNGDYVTYAEKALHHEFSSALIDKHHFPKGQWLHSNKGEYDSDDLGRDKLADGPGYERRSLLRQGFLTTYGSSDIENDINVYADYLFTRPKRLKTLAAKYLVIKKKHQLFKRFYCRIDKRFSFCRG